MDSGGPKRKGTFELLSRKKGNIVRPMRFK